MRIDTNNNTQPKMKQKPPKGVTIQIGIGSPDAENKCCVANKYKEPLKNNTPKVVNQPESFNVFEGKSLDNKNMTNKVAT